jgi:hypothetical protein
VLSKGKEYIEEKTGVKLPMPGDQLSDELLTSLKQREMEMQEFLISAALEEKKLDITAYGIEVDDRKNARTERGAILTNENTPWLVRVEHVLVGFVILAVWGGVQYFLLTASVPEGQREIITRMLGTLDAALMVYLYWLFGTSRSSGSKDRVIAQMAKD